MVHPAVYAVIPMLSLGLAALYYVFKGSPSETHGSGPTHNPRYPNSNTSSSNTSNLRRRRKLDYDDNECQICQDASCNVEILPCHHREICEQCVNAIITKVDRLCPFCRQFIQGYRDI
ncbi:hypothetical protein SNE40_000910 [Patella caerulea]|uniref:RING-type domain-containing protein n=1 Tax=Patella caerulea TaxID=87958 RepID=A0AAN8Q2A0_PATCE